MPENPEPHGASGLLIENPLKWDKLPACRVFPKALSFPDSTGFYVLDV